MPIVMGNETVKSMDDYGSYNYVNHASIYASSQRFLGTTSLLYWKPQLCEEILLHYLAIKLSLPPKQDSILSLAGTFYRILAG